jgi:hypothetical protein
MMGSTTGGVWASDDGGDTWQTVSTTLPPIYAVQFIGKRRKTPSFRAGI